MMLERERDGLREEEMRCPTQDNSCRVSEEGMMHFLPVVVPKAGGPFSITPDDVSASGLCVRFDRRPRCQVPMPHKWLWDRSFGRVSRCTRRKKDSFLLDAGKSYGDAGNVTPKVPRA